MICVCLFAACAEGSSDQEAVVDAAPDASTQRRDASRQSQPDAALPPSSKYEADSRPFPSATFVGSETTVLDPALGSVAEQLSAGVRYLHLPIHDNDFRDRDDFGLGDDSPSDGLSFGAGNPNDEKLASWLAVIATWSKEHPNHAPITLALDLRDNLADNTSFEQGDLHRLNQTLADAFGDALFVPREVEDDSWPSVDAMRGRIVVLFQGHEKTRVMYRETIGSNPVVAMNSKQDVVAVHQVGLGLQYWFGTRGEDAREVDWFRTGVVPGTFIAPAISLNDDGLMVLVASSSPLDSEIPLVYLVVGEMLLDGGVFWRKPNTLGPGTHAIVRFDEATSSTVQVVVDPGTEDEEQLEILVRRNDGDINIVGEPSSKVEPWDPALVTGGEGQSLRVFADAGQIIRYETEQKRGRIAPRQLAFAEYKLGDAATLRRWFRFTDDLEQGADWISQGWVLRAPFSASLMASMPLPTLIVDVAPFRTELMPYLELPVSEDTPE